jgi:hypothetical protein
MSIADLVWAHNAAEIFNDLCTACCFVSIHSHSYIYSVQTYLYTEYNTYQIIHIKQVQQGPCESSYLVTGEYKYKHSICRPQKNIVKLKSCHGHEREAGME